MEKRWDRASSAILFTIIFAAELGFGIYVMYYNDYISGDSLSRVANAFFVLHSRDPHLGAIGFVWNPLPSMLEMIPLLLWDWVPSVASSGLASAAVTAFFAAAAALLLYLAVVHNGGGRIPGLLLAIVYTANPFNFVYGSNGMSEAIFAFFIIATVYTFTRWITTRRLSYLIYGGLALAMGFWTRYEAVALGIGLTLCFVWAVFQQHRSLMLVNRKQLLQRHNLRGRLEAVLLVFLVPSIVSGALWIMFNYLIMQDPLYFLRSGYSNLAFAEDLTANQQFVDMIGSPVAVLSWVLRKSAYFSIPLLGILAVRILTRRIKDLDTFWLLLVSLSIPAMQFYMLYNGSSYGWLRFFVYPMVIAAAWIPYEISCLESHKARKPLIAFLIACLAASSFVVMDMQDPELATEEYGLFHMSDSTSSRDHRMSREIALAVDELVKPDEEGGKLVLTDSFSAFPILVNSAYPAQWIITNDRDFNENLKDPVGKGVDYILVSKAKGSVYRVIDANYPFLFEGRETWTRLVKDFNGEWRLYQVISPGSSS
ncbi:MAG: hypothetical protein K0R57_3883 [Paenibacillaceae bacterium]|jgi:hypothetical protein|nr:hypothetical protein [Paenibacillaceae bacterium]